MNNNMIKDKNMLDGSTESKRTFLWYIAAGAAIVGFAIIGTLSAEPGSYYNTSDTTPWWSPVKIFVYFLLFSLVPLLVPLPHIVLALPFKSMRNKTSIFKIFRGWHKALFAFFVVGLVSWFINSSLKQQSADQLYYSSSSQAYEFDYKKSITYTTKCIFLTQSLGGVNGEIESISLKQNLQQLLIESGLSVDEGQEIMRSAGNELRSEIKLGNDPQTLKEKYCSPA